MLSFFIGEIVINQFYSESKSKEFLGCENYTFDPKLEKVKSNGDSHDTFVNHVA